MTFDSYDFLNNLSIVVLIGWVISQTKAFTDICPHALRQKTARARWWVAAVEFVVISYSGVLLLLVLNRKFGIWFTEGNSNYYGSLTAYLLAYAILTPLLGISTLRSLDLFTPGLALSLVVSKMACFSCGCCSSFEMPGSFYYSYTTHRHEFPVQLLEAAVALMLFIFLLWYRKRGHRSGTVFPVYVIAYSVTRFFVQFLRTDISKIHGRIDAYHTMSVIFLIIGLLLLWFVRVSGDSVNAYFDKKLVIKKSNGVKAGKKRTANAKDSNKGSKKKSAKGNNKNRR